MSKVDKDIKSIVTDVRVAYDEIAQNDAMMIGDQDESELDTIIRSKIDEAINFVYSNANVDYLEDDDNVAVYDGYVKAEDETLLSDKTCILDIDKKIEGWVRLVWVKMDSWMYAVSDIMSRGDKDAAYVSDPYCGATYEKPAVVLSRTSKGRELRIYRASNDNEEGVNVAYVKKFSMSEDESTTFGSSLYSAIVYYICSLVAMTFNETERSREYMEMAATIMGIKAK